MVASSSLGHDAIVFTTLLACNSSVDTVEGQKLLLNASNQPFHWAKMQMHKVLHTKEEKANNIIHSQGA